MRRYALVAAGVMMATGTLLMTGWKSSSLPTNMPTTHVEVATTTSPESVYALHATDIYTSAALEEAGLPFSVFEKALTGFYNLKSAGKLSPNSILSIADFDQASSKKRLYIIDVNKKKIILNTWVAHGKNSGDNDANFFSNVNSSNASSIGFYVTGEEYSGKHGRSLKLDGMDVGFNDHARDRAIVVHGADYVNAGIIRSIGRLGRSQGCPAVAPELANQVIDVIENKTVFFINKSVDNYRSKYLNASLAANYTLGNI